MGRRSNCSGSASTRFGRPLLAALVATLTASVAGANGADLFVEPDFIVLPTYVSGEVARLRMTVQSRRDAPLEIEQIEIRDLRFTVRVPDGWSGEGIDRVPCAPPLRIEPRGSLALEFETPTRRRVGLYRKSIVVKVRGNPDPIPLAEVSARIVKGFSVTPESVEFGDVVRGETPALEATVEAQELGPFKLRSASPTERPGESPWFTVTTSPDSGSKASRRHVVSMKIDAAAAPGKHFGNVDLETDSPQHTVIHVAVQARIRTRVELHFRDVVVDIDAATTLSLGALRRTSDPVEIVVRDTRDMSDWRPGEATLLVKHGGGDAAIDPKFEVETTPGSTGAERRIRLRLLEPGSPHQVAKGELRLPLHHPDLDELVLPWTAFCLDR